MLYQQFDCTDCHITATARGDRSLLARWAADHRARRHAVALTVKDDADD